MVSKTKLDTLLDMGSIRTVNYILKSCHQYTLFHNIMPSSIPEQSRQLKFDWQQEQLKLTFTLTITTKTIECYILATTSLF